MQAKVDQKTTLEKITQSSIFDLNFFKPWMNQLMKTIHQFQAMLLY
jgi:hypothetical protein